MLAEIVSAAIGFVRDAASRIANHFIDKRLAEKSRDTAPRVMEIVVVDRRMQTAAIEYTNGRSSREQALRDLRASLARNQELAALDEYHGIVAHPTDDTDLIDLSRRTLELREQALDIIRQKVAHDRQLAELQKQLFERFFELKRQETQILQEELNERRRLGLLHLELLREREAKDIQLKLDEIQAHWDRENWSGILSRSEMQQILAAGQKRHRLLLLVSPPDISEDCPEAFVRNLQMDVRGALKQFLEEHYPVSDDSCSVEFYGKFFKASVFDVEVKQLESLLAPIPTAVIYSDITDEVVRLHIRLWGIERPFSLTIPWNWEQAKNALTSNERVSEKDALRVVRQSIVRIHQWTAAFLADMYFLTINPHHSPRMYHAQGELPDDLISPSVQLLKRIQADITEQYERQLKIFASQAEIEATRRRLREEEDRALGQYKELRDLLEARRWAEADAMTRTLMLKATERTSAGALDQASIETFPRQELATIDKLWTQYSEGKFGFAVQKRILDECDKDVQSFLIHVGWAHPISQNTYRTTVRFSLSAPEGHLPVCLWNLPKGAPFGDAYLAFVKLFLEKLPVSANA